VAEPLRVTEGSVAPTRPLPQLMTAAEVARVLRVTTHRVYELGRLGVLPAVPIGRQRRWRENVIREFVEGGGAPLAGGWRREPA